MTPSYATLVDRYRRSVLWIGESTGWTDTVLHIHGGMAVLVLARLLTRRSLGTFVPLGVVAAAALVKEVLDRPAHGAWLWADSGLDLANTLFWPLVITLAVRLRPLVGRDRARSRRT